MKKLLSVLLSLALMLSCFTTAMAADEKVVHKTGKVVWQNIELTMGGEKVVVNITLDGIVGIQVDETVYYDDLPIKYLNVYEDDENITYSEGANGSLYTWNGEGKTPVQGGIKVLPIAPGATLKFDVVSGNKDLLDFYPGYYGFVKGPNKNELIICNGMGQAYAMSTSYTFDKKINGDYDNMVYEFPIRFEKVTFGLLLVNEDTYNLPKDVGELSNFELVREYSETTFNDIQAGEWYEESVKTSYQLGIINGKGDGSFDPKGELTIAQALSMACKTYELYYGGDGLFPKTGNKWYDGVVAYALRQGFITEGQFTNYDRAITRAELASFFAKAIGADQYQVINDMTTLPDVDSKTQYSEDIFTLYRAGIVTGSDAIGTFHPTTPINRAAAATIIDRVINPDKRRTVTFGKDQKDKIEETKVEEVTNGSDTLFVLDSEDRYELMASYGNFEKVTNVTVEPIVYPIGYNHTLSEKSSFPTSEFIMKVKNPESKYKTLSFDIVVNKLGSNGLGNVSVMDGSFNTIKELTFTGQETNSFRIDITGHQEAMINFNLNPGSDVSIFLVTLEQ